MLLNNIIAFFSGYVELLVRGSQLEKFINLATGSGLYLWEVRRIGNDLLYVKMRAHGFLRLRSIIKKTDCTVKICQKEGWPFLSRKFGKRKMFFVGSLFFCAALFYLSSFVLFIKLDGLPKSEKSQLLSQLYRAGLRQGMSRTDLIKKKNLIERETMLHTPKIVWLGINLKGVVAEVKVVPRKMPPEPNDVSDIVAASDGVITKVVVIRGVPLVKEGDVVLRGQLLISGTQWYNNLQSGEMYKQEVPASGMVEAKVWYDLEVVEPKKVWKPVSQNIKYTNYKLRWGKQAWNLIKYGKKPKKDYFWERRCKQIYRGRNPLEVVEIIKDTWEGVAWRQIRRPLSEIKRSALTELELKRKLLNYPEITKHNLTWVDEGTFLKLRVTVEDVRDIAKIVPR